MDPTPTLSRSISALSASAATGSTPMVHAASLNPDTMGMSKGECLPSVMLWNWNTIDSCLVSKNWHITSTGMFAGSCIAVVLLTMSLELLRRMAKEYDRRIVREHQERVALAHSDSEDNMISHSPSTASRSFSKSSSSLEMLKARTRPFLVHGNDPARFRPHLAQQLIRGLLHTLQFTVAYFVMLLAMYYNGYIILSIIIGAFLGFVVFEWEWIECGTYKIGPKEEATSCCG